MSPTTHKGARRGPRSLAPVFAALGDQTRLEIVAKLGRGSRRSISQLAEGSSLTRQAITKHLRVLQNAGVIKGVRKGRERLFELRPEALDEVRRSLDQIAAQWDRALLRLKAFVED